MIPENLANSYKATTAFPVGWSNCSASHISPDGYLLTAFHCVIGGLQLESKYGKKLADQAEVVSVPQEAVIGKEYVGWDNFKATVIAAGQGFGQFDERLVDTYDPSVLETIQTVIGTDWAVLKVDNVKDHACLVTATESPKEGEYSWTIGYPGATQRKVGEKTNNYKKLVSYGKVSHSAEESGYYKTLTPLNRKISLDFWDLLIKRGEFLITDSDSQGGNSGSPIINQKSKLIGVLVQGLLPSQDISYQQYHTYSTGIIDLQSIRETLGEKFQNYFTCGNHRNEREVF